VDKPNTVWDNLRNLGVSPDLTLLEEVSLPCGFKRLPRETLSSDQHLFDLLFSLLDKPTTAEQAWHLLQRLPPSLALMLQLQDPSIFASDALVPILDPESPYRLVYVLLLLEAQIGQEATYLTDFLHKGGLKQLLQLQGRLALKAGLQNIKLALLKMVRSIILICCSSKCPKLTKSVSLLQGGFSVDEIINFVEKEESILVKLRQHEGQAE
jgi:hypothetical protein